MQRVAHAAGGALIPCHNELRGYAGVYFKRIENLQLLILTMLRVYARTAKNFL